MFYAQGQRAALTKLGMLPILPMLGAGAASKTLFGGGGSRARQAPSTGSTGGLINNLNPMNLLNKGARGVKNMVTKAGHGYNPSSSGYNIAGTGGAWGA